MAFVLSIALISMVSIVGPARAQVVGAFCLSTSEQVGVTYALFTTATGGGQFLGTGERIETVDFVSNTPLRLTGFLQGTSMTIGFLGVSEGPLFGSITLDTVAGTGSGKLCTRFECIRVAKFSLISCP